MKYSDIPTAQSIVLLCQSKGIKDIVISPGSRNAPLTIGFSEHPYFNCYSIVDERCAAFFALGIALQQKRPVALVCTSGSALLNYYPAVAEAFYSDVPLVLITADRPPYKIDVGDGQTIRQKHVFKNHIGYEANLKLDVDHARDTIAHFAPHLLQERQDEINDHNQAELNKAFHVAYESGSPVHINVPFEEPLYGKIEEPVVSISESPTKKVNSTFDQWERLTNVWNASQRKMVIAGTMPPHHLEAPIIDRLGNDTSMIVFTETTSNLHHPDFFPSIDSIIFPIEKSAQKEAFFEQLRPDLLITMGGMVVSKKIKAFLRQFKPKAHWHIDPKKAYDTYFSSVEQLKIEPNDFFERLFKLVPSCENDYRQGWLRVKTTYESKRSLYLEKIPFSDFWAFDRCIRCIPNHYQVHFANSSAIRYAQLFSMDVSNTVYCNRGASGIDGSTSTAIGAALYEKHPTLLITGDLSFFYDSNALWNDYIKKDFRIIIVNNGGGGIFRILPGKENSENFQRYFETRHPYQAGHIAQMYQFEYEKVQDKEDLKVALTHFFKASDGPKILEVCTPSDINDEILLGYFDFIS